VAGRNKATLRRLEAMKAKVLSRTRLAPLGYVSNMNELMAASDVVVGKAGASTAMEAAFMSKPFIFTEWATYNDRFIINFALNYHVGWYCPTVFAFSQVVRRIVDTEVLSEYKRNLENLSVEPGTDEVADFLLKSSGALPDR
jgi:processive 1,2-diacylglycerol beta-glucosyltransferase